MKEDVQRQEMVKLGAEQLFKAERSIQVAMGDTAALMSSLSLMSQHDISIMIGQEAFEEIMASLTALTSARGAIARSHTALDLVKTHIGCGAVAVTPSPTKPPKTDDTILIQPRRAA
ncbi:MAG: hypothetical protein NVV72_10800 [Asticcacaulis sp.]|nr:hypothetical protein [Asticcacaulis sp.]